MKTDPGYTILSARYANSERTAVVAHTTEAACVAASERGRPKLWARIHASVPIEPYDPANPLPSQKTRQDASGTPPLPPAALPPPAAGTAFLEAPGQPQEPPSPPVPASVSWTLPQSIQPVRLLWSGQMDDVERRAAAKARVMGAVISAAQTTLGDQMRYELALQAKNENVRAMALLELEASIVGRTVGKLAEQIIEDRRVRERRMMQVYAILARVSADIDKATASAIDTLADAGVREISTMEA